MTDWNEIRNEYINGNISYRKLAKKYKVSANTLQEKGKKEEWVKQRKLQHDKIEAKTRQKAAEKIAKDNVRRLERINTIIDKLIDKTEQAIEESNVYLARDKIRVNRKMPDPYTGEPTTGVQEKENFRSVKADRIDKAGLTQTVASLKALIEMSQALTGDGNSSDSNDKTININIVDTKVDEQQE